MWLSKHFIIFVFFSFLGWIWESIYCTLMMRKWQARGFLYGPVCPIYGFGAVGGIIIFELMRESSIEPSWWQIFLFSMLGSAVLEYFTSWALEKLFHAYWWDYSRVPLNLHGRISLPTSLAFGAAGLLIYFVLAPMVERALGKLTPQVSEIAAMLMLVIITVDTTLTVSALSEFDEKIGELDVKFNDKMTDIVDNAIARTGAVSRAALKRVKGFRHPKAGSKKKNAK